MCEMCDIKADTDKKWGELEFRTTQYQIELDAGRTEEAARCKERAQFLFDAVFENLDKFISLKMTMDDAPDLGQLLRGKLN